MVSPKNSFLDWDTTAGSNTDVGGIGILGTNAVNNFDDALRTIMAQLRTGIDGKVVYASKSGNYTALAADNNAVHRYTTTVTVALTAAATLGANWHYTVTADGGAVTIDPNASETINGLATLTVPNGSTAEIICDGSNFFTVIKPMAWETISEVSFTSVATVDFTNLGSFRKLRLTGNAILSASVGFYLRSSTNNGSSYDSGASDYLTQLFGIQGTGSAATTNTAGALPISSTSGVDLNTACSFSIVINLFNSSSAGMQVLSDFMGVASSTFYRGLSAGTRSSTTARNALRLLPGSGTFSGSVTLEGVRG